MKIYHNNKEIECQIEYITKIDDNLIELFILPFDDTIFQIWNNSKLLSINNEKDSFYKIIKFLEHNNGYTVILGKTLPLLSET